jgi:hypothetical protein
MTQDDLANLLMVHKTFICNAENHKQRAKYNLRHINILAWYFDMSIGDFMPKEPFEPDDTYSFHRTPHKKNHGTIQS